MNKMETQKNTDFFIEETKKLIDQNAYFRITQTNPSQATFSSVDIIYQSTTENMAEYSKYIGNPKSILTSCGSGDHILNALTLGAEEIYYFDINFLAYYAAELKLAAIKTLTKGEFFAFYETFPYNLFERILPALKPNAQKFWYEIFNYAKENIKPDLFGYIPLERNTVKRINNFSEKKEYNKLKEQAEKAYFNFLTCDIFELQRKIRDKKFDHINLSNIYEYTNTGINLSYQNAINFYNYIMSLVDNNLNNDGTILVSYLYNYNQKVREYVQKLMNQGIFPPTKKMLTIEEANLAKSGYTTQKIAYKYLCQVFENHSDFIPVQSVSPDYGDSFDKTQDLALIYKKSN